MRQITVLIVDEHPEVSARLADGLSRIAGLRVVAHTTNPVWAAEFAHHWKPRIIIADFKRGPRSRSEMIAWLKRNSPGSQIVVFGSYYLDDERGQLQAAGAAACLLKGLTLNELAGQIRIVAQTGGGETAVSSSADFTRKRRSSNERNLQRRSVR